MKKKRIFGKLILAFATASLFCLMLSLSVSAAQKYNFPEGAADVNITLNSRAVLDGEAAIIDSVTYVPLRSFSELCGADSVSWDASTRTATVKKYNLVAKISDRKNYIEANGRYIYLIAPVKNIDDRLFVPIRPISLIFSLDVNWNSDSRTVVLKNTTKVFKSAKEVYNENDLYWLSRIINAEAGGESLMGKIAVGNVVINRKNSRSFPNSIYGVIFDRKYGTQFSPVAIGTIYKTPNAESVIAAKICLEGYSVSDEILYFMNPRLATSNWISKNRPFAFRIGNHNFYK
ncbi:MAG: cell wall hydrolase [Clostridia bacterium]|nr:cell wall hydrolase [Clostridia bacterium]